MDREANGSKLRNLIAAAVVAAAVGVGGYFIGKGDAPAAEPVAKIDVEPATTTLPAVVDVTLGRADIVRLGNEAADAAAGGPAIVDNLDGRRFVIRIPIGCDARTPGVGRGRAELSTDSEVLRIRIQPEDWTSVPWVKSQLASRQLAAAEGFWIPRPWTRSENCPAAAARVALPETAMGSADSPPAAASDNPAVPAKPVVAGFGVGIAALFDSESSRVGQRKGRALDATILIDPDTPDATAALTMVLTGRVAKWPGGDQTVLCNASGPYDRPTCLVGVELDRITVENIQSGARLSEWQF